MCMSMNKNKIDISKIKNNKEKINVPKKISLKKLGE